LRMAEKIVLAMLAHLCLYWTSEKYCQVVRRRDNGDVHSERESARILSIGRWH
jgi:hypothetical protein